MLFIDQVYLVSDIKSSKKFNSNPNYRRSRKTQLRAKSQHSPLLQIKNTNLNDFDVVGT